MITYKNACDEICEEAEEWEPEVNNEEEEDLVEEVILPGVDWESVCYQVPHLINQDVVARVKSDFYQVTFRYVRYSKKCMSGQKVRKPSSFSAFPSAMPLKNSHLDPARVNICDQG